MADTIVNRIAESALITFDLEDLYQIGERKSIDLSQWLFKGLILKEKEYRATSMPTNGVAIKINSSHYTALLRPFYLLGLFFCSPPIFNPLPEK